MKVSQLCPTLCYPMDCIARGILQARLLEWVAFPFSRGSSQPRDRTDVSHIADRFFTSWATREAQEYWSGYTIASPADLPTLEVKPGSPALWVDSLPPELWGLGYIQCLSINTRQTAIRFSKVQTLCFIPAHFYWGLQPSHLHFYWNAIMLERS